MKIPPGPNGDYLEKKKKDGNEGIKIVAKKSAPVFIVKQATKTGGLDYLHIALILLVVILVGLSLSLSRFSAIKTVNCEYGMVNGTCTTAPQYLSDSGNAIMAAKRIIAGYSASNTSFALLPYYTIPSEYNATYIQNIEKWLVYTPYNDPYTNQTVSMFLILNKNFTLNESLTQTIPPPYITENYVVANGTVKIAGHVLSTTSKPIPVNLVIDPYSKDSISAIKAMINASQLYGNSITPEYDFIFTGAAQSKYASFGTVETQAIAAYLFCASNQTGFPVFVNDLSVAFSGNPVQVSSLDTITNQSGINYTYMKNCVLNSAKPLYYQSLFAQFYNITSTPEFIINGDYETVSTKLDGTIKYALSSG